VRYRVRLWCRDCTGEDSQGCFEGGIEIVTDDGAPFGEATFATVEEAREEGHEWTKDCGPWRFEIIDEDGKVVTEER
jgi:hypothetical protein